MGLRAVEPLTGPLDSDSELTRLHAQRAWEGVVYGRHGFKGGQGFPSAEHEAAAVPTCARSLLVRGRAGRAGCGARAPAGLARERADMSEDELAALLRQVERAGLFTHSALGRGHLRQRELESFVYGLIDVLTARGLIAEGELSAAVEAVREQMDNSGEVPEPGVVLRVDTPEAADMPPGRGRLRRAYARLQGGLLPARLRARLRRGSSAACCGGTWAART
jgi:hypothetical protein